MIALGFNYVAEVAEIGQSCLKLAQDIQEDPDLDPSMRIAALDALAEFSATQAKLQRTLLAVVEANTPESERGLLNSGA